MAQLAQFARVQKLVASALVANPDDMSYAAASLDDQQKYAPEHINDAIQYADMEIVKFIKQTVGDARRLGYGSYQAVTNGANIPYHPGKIGSVEIKKTSSSSFRRGIKVESIEALNKLLENPDGRYGSAAITYGRYHIDEEIRVFFTGSACQIFIPDDIAIIPGQLWSPADEEPAIARGAIVMLAKDPLDPNLFGFYHPLWQADEIRIKSLGGPAPILDMYAKAGG